MTVEDPAIPMNVKVENVSPSMIMVGCSVTGDVTFFDVSLTDKVSGKVLDNIKYDIPSKISLHQYSLTVQVRVSSCRELNE